MTIREFEELIKKYPISMPVFIADTEKNQIICNFEFHQSIIHPSMFWTYAYVDNGKHSYYGLNVSNILRRIEATKTSNKKIGYKGQEEDYAEPEDMHILMSGNMKSVYCGKYKYVTPITIEKIDDKLIIICKGE